MAWYDLEFMEKQLAEAKAGMFGDKSQAIAAEYELLIAKEKYEQETGQKVNLADYLGGKTLDEFFGIKSTTPTYEQVFKDYTPGTGIPIVAENKVVGVVPYDTPTSKITEIINNITGKVTAAGSQVSQQNGGFQLPDLSGLIAALTSGINNTQRTELIPSELKRPILYAGLFILALMILKR